MLAPATLPTPATPQGPLQLLIVCPRGEHLDTARRLARQRSGHHAVHWTVDPERAVQLALQMAQQRAPALAIVDARIDRATAGDLVQRLNRCCGQMAVLSFDDRDSPISKQAPSTWYWAEMPRAMDWWQAKGPR